MTITRVARYHYSIWLLCLLLFLCRSTTVDGVSQCNQRLIASSSIPTRHYRSSYSRTEPFSGRDPQRSQYQCHKHPYNDITLYPINPLELTRLASSKDRKQKQKRKRKSYQEEDPQQQQASNDVSNNEDPFAVPMTSQEIYRELGPIAKCVAGTVEIAISTVMEYITGFMGGYVLGTVTDMPRFVFRQVDANNKFLQELSQRYGRMHAKSMRWAKSWAGISAAFGGFRVATRVVRGGKEDEWNTIISSAAAGAFFARNEGPQGMLKGALTYGGMMYLFSGGLLSGGNKEPFQYQDQPIEF